MKRAMRPASRCNETEELHRLSNTSVPSAQPRAPDLRLIFLTWLPLATSWLLMGTELPMVSAVIARLDDPKIHLAAYGGVVFPLALIIESPIIMLLSASTALSKDWASYRRLWSFMMWAGGLLTCIHFLIAYTPLYDLVVVRLLRPPAEIVPAARLGLMIMLPWTWSIAFRRFHQGVLIRFERARVVWQGTAIRLMTNAIAMLLAYVIGARIGGLPGIAVGSIGIASGVLVEAAYIGWRSQSTLRGPLRAAAPVVPVLTGSAFFSFYWPLALTAILTLVVQPLGSAAISRMPRALDSLAVWPVLSGFLFMWRSLGFAFNEVVIALLDHPGSPAPLRRFAVLLSVWATFGLLLVAATPLANLWFEGLSGLPSELAELARRGLWVALIWPALEVTRNWFQGVLVHSKRTRPVPEAVTIFLITTGGSLAIGVVVGRIAGLYLALAAFVLGMAVQDLWMWYRSRQAVRQVFDMDSSYPSIGRPSPSQIDR